LAPTAVQLALPEQGQPRPDGRVLGRPVCGFTAISGNHRPAGCDILVSVGRKLRNLRLAALVERTGRVALAILRRSN
jgi:hypothetical protein